VLFLLLHFWWFLPLRDVKGVDILPDIVFRWVCTFDPALCEIQTKEAVPMTSQLASNVVCGNSRCTRISWQQYPVQLTFHRSMRGAAFFHVTAHWSLVTHARSSVTWLVSRVTRTNASNTSRVSQVANRTKGKLSLRIEFCHVGGRLSQQVHRLQVWCYDGGETYWTLLPIVSNVQILFIHSQTFHWDWVCIQNLSYKLKEMVY
jgi:hypothetical protein